MSGDGREILLTGGSGQVGRALRALAPSGWRIAAPGHAELDLGDPVRVAETIAARPWAAVINAAAYTAVDRAETDVAAAWRANAIGPAVLAEATGRAGIPLVHLSTDYVFDGRKPEPYVEDDAPSPLNVYGASKLGGELAVRTANPRHLILRCAWVVSATGSNFVKTMLRLGAERPVLRVVDDQRGCPTTAGDIAAVLQAVTDRLIEDETAPAGTFHFVSDGEASWCDLARHVFALSRAAGGPSPEVLAIATEDYPTPAVRPSNSVLSTRKIQNRFGVRPRPWRDAVADVVQQLAAGAAAGVS